MKNNAFWWIVVVIVVVLIGTGIWWAVSQSNTPVSASNDTTNSNLPTDNVPTAQSTVTAGVTASTTGY